MTGEQSFQTLEAFRTRGELDGYRSGVPPWGRQGGESIDIEVCRDSACTRCGHQGLECRPFHHVESRSYLAFAVCPRCHHAEKF